MKKKVGFKPRLAEEFGLVDFNFKNRLVLIKKLTRYE